MTSPPPGQPISLAAGATFVAGGFIVGAIFTPDMSRFNRTPADVVKQTLVGVTLGEFFVGVIGVLLVHAIKGASESPSMVVAIIQSTVGPLGVLILCISIIKVNDWNLYPSGLGLTNAIHGLFGVRLNRAYVTAALGVIGSVLSALGISNTFQAFLTELGILFPPIAAIMIADYYIVRSWRAELTASQPTLALPGEAPSVVPAGLIAWAIGWAFGKFTFLIPAALLPFHIPAVTSLIVTFCVYIALGKLAPALARGYALRPTRLDSVA